MSLNRVLVRLYHNRAELLRALDRHEIALHNNATERDVREYIEKRKSSESTRTVAGRRYRDTFASLSKTYRKHSLLFWDYLNDRLTGI